MCLRASAKVCGSRSYWPPGASRAGRCGRDTSRSPRSLATRRANRCQLRLYCRGNATRAPRWPPPAIRRVSKSTPTNGTLPRNRVAPSRFCRSRSTTSVPATGPAVRPVPVQATVLPVLRLVSYRPSKCRRWNLPFSSRPQRAMLIFSPVHRSYSVLRAPRKRTLDASSNANGGGDVSSTSSHKQLLRMRGVCGWMVHRIEENEAKGFF